MKEKELLIQYDQEVNRLRDIIKSTQFQLKYLINAHLKQGLRIDIVALKHLEGLLEEIDNERN